MSASSTGNINTDPNTSTEDQDVNATSITENPNGTQSDEFVGSLQTQNAPQLASTGVWELIPTLMINFIYIICNLIKGVLRIFYNLFFTSLKIIEALLGIDGWLSEPLRDSVPAQVVWSLIESTSLIPIGGSLKEIYKISVSLLGQVSPIVQCVLQRILNFINKIKYTIIWSILVVKEAVLYPWKSFKTAFQKG